MTHFLDFEQPVAELQAKIAELRLVNPTDIDIQEEIAQLEKKSVQLTQRIFAKLTDWQRVLLARHPERPYLLDYIPRLFTDFQELHGDRRFADDPAIVSGLARFNGHSVVIIGHQKGRDTKEKIRRNFGMASPEGYRKALRMLQLAEKFGLPVLTFIDTPGAHPGIGAEERGQSQAIAENLATMSQLSVPIISTVIGEGGSGGALGIGVCDCLLMLEYSIYSTISPEGCASILWKKAEKAPEAAAIMGITAARLHELGLIDRIVQEPLGGAHTDWDEIARRLKQAILEELPALQSSDISTLQENRYRKIMDYGPH